VLTLEDLMELARPTAEVEVGGRKITLRALLAAERRAVGDSWPEPPAPLINNLNSREKIRDDSNPTWRQKCEERGHAIGCAIVAVAMQYMVGGQTFPFTGEAPQRKAWIEGAARELSGAFTVDALVAMSDRILDLERQQFSAADRIGTEKRPGN